MINKIIWKIRKKGDKIWNKLFSKKYQIISLLLFQSSGIGEKLFPQLLPLSCNIILLNKKYIYIPIFWNWRKIISPIIATFLQQFFIYIVFFPYFDNCQNMEKLTYIHENTNKFVNILLNIIKIK